jgi:hypothetical protein
MTTFPCFASSFDFAQDLAVVDVATIIATFQARVTGQAPAWTVPVAGTFKSPVDAVGRFMEVTLPRVSATRLNCVCTDQNGITIINREIDISGLGTTVNYYTGQFHAVVEALEATPEIFQAGILDETPQDEDAILDYVYANAYRNAGGGVDGNGGGVNLLFMLDNGGAANANRWRSVAQTPAGVIGLKDPTGALQFFPCDTQASVGGVVGWVGRLYQSYICDGGLATGLQKTVKIGDAGETGTFQVLGLASANGMKQMVRVA